jgi:uncharacterized membrane protein
MMMMMIIIIIQFFIICVPSEQLQGQLQDQRNIKPKINYRKLLEEKHINGESKQTNKQRREVTRIT